MLLPDKTFLTTNNILFESDFECNGQVKPLRLMQLMQNIATEHAADLGMGWDVLNRRGVLWVLSKMKILLCKDLRAGDDFTLYTWPLAPRGLFVERCFAAVNAQGEEVFCATSLWLIISKAERKILQPNFLNTLYIGDYSQAHADAGADFHRVRKDENFEFCYEKHIMRSDLDKNGHVNNTNYITYALDTLNPDEKISSAEIVYNKELHLGEKARIYAKRDSDRVFVVGETTETNFSAVLTLIEPKEC